MKDSVEILLMAFAGWLAILIGRAVLTPEVAHMEADDTYRQAGLDATADDLDWTEPTKLPPDKPKPRVTEQSPAVQPPDAALSQHVSPIQETVPLAPLARPTLSPPSLPGQSDEPAAISPGDVRPLPVEQLAQPPLAKAKPRESQPLVYYWHEDMNAAELAGRERDLPLLIFFTQTNCVLCKVVKNQALKDRRVRQALERGYVLAWINCDKEPLIAQEFHVTATPRIVLWRPHSPEYKSFEPPSEPLHFLTELATNREQYDKEISQ